MALLGKDSPKDRTSMAKDTNGSQTPRDGEMPAAPIVPIG